jgi:hypothetical protein
LTATSNVGAGHVADARDGWAEDHVVELLGQRALDLEASNSPLSRTVLRAGIWPDLAHSPESSLR